MKKIPEILLRQFLLRYPIQVRLNWVAYLGKYAWLKTILDEIRPELFPAKPEVLAQEVVPLTPAPDPEILELLQRSEIQGKVGYYQVLSYLGPRGHGHLFKGIEVKSQRPVVIKEFLLPRSQFTKVEALQRQQSFRQLAGIQLTDGRMQEFRVMQPLEAIADSTSYERCFLVTGDRDALPTLRQRLQSGASFTPEQIRDLLSQILQSLNFLHYQKFTLPSGAIQVGLIHGNLSLDSLLWREVNGQAFIYLCDLRLWEKWFTTSRSRELLGDRPIAVKPETIQEDLKAVGQIGSVLLADANLAGANLAGANTQASIVRPMQQILADLQAAGYESADKARQELLRLATRSPAEIAGFEALSSPPVKDTAPGLTPLLVMGGLGLLAAGIALLPRLHAAEARATVMISNCCVKEVSAIPAAAYRYTAVQGGTWATVLNNRNLLGRGQGLVDVLAREQPKLQLEFMPSQSLQAVYQQIEQGAMDFAVVPVVDELPPGLLGEAIAYDGLATVVSFSYSQRQKGLPAALGGQLNLRQVQALYAGDLATGGGNLGQSGFLGQGQNLGELPFGQRYVTQNPEAIAIFEQKVLRNRPLSQLGLVKKLPAIDLLRRIIRDFEERQMGSIGIVTLSEAWGQCSVYPLAVAQEPHAAVQPLVLSDGQVVTPETDLCNSKGAYGPDRDKIQRRVYPLSYPIMVIYPRDNRRSAIAKKFVEMMRTLEGQRLLQAAGLVPLTPDSGRPEPSRSAQAPTQVSQ
jgi:hypothetical protein